MIFVDWVQLEIWEISGFFGSLILTKLAKESEAVFVVSLCFNKNVQQQRRRRRKLVSTKMQQANHFMKPLKRNDNDIC